MKEAIQEALIHLFLDVVSGEGNASTQQTLCHTIVAYLSQKAGLSWQDMWDTSSSLENIELLSAYDFYVQYAASFYETEKQSCVNVALLKAWVNHEAFTALYNQFLGDVGNDYY